MSQTVMKTERRGQNVINNIVAFVCVLALMLLCSEPADGTSFNAWLLWELCDLVIVVVCAAYLNKHLPDDSEK